jgi:PAS domain S-box-containing protein
LVIGSGLIVVVLFVTINATLKARLQAEDALEKAGLEVKDLYNNAPCGYHSINPDGLIVEMNKTWLEWLGLQREDVVRKKYLVDFLTPHSREEFLAKFELLKSRDIVNNIEFEVLGKDNKPLFLYLSASAVHDDKGNFVKTRSTVFNITDRHVAEAKVVEANKELEAFSYSVSHDLRAPLRSINGYSKILEEDYAPQLGEEGNRILQIIRKNAQRMGQLIDDLLNFSRLGRKELEKTMLNMNSLVENVQQELMMNEDGRHVEFDIKLLENAYGDSSMLRQVWINLISNALKYSRRKPMSKIEIGCHRDEGKGVFYIRDNGVGFDMAYSEKLFGVFQRLHRVEEFDGTGVGLALVHRIISRHGGQVWAKAVLNEGATFFFSIPLTKPDVK